MCELFGAIRAISCDTRNVIPEIDAKAELSDPDGWGTDFYAQNDAYVFRRSHADGVHTPGLHYISRQCDQKINSLPCIGLIAKITMSKTQTLTLIASVPLSDEAWTPIAEINYWCLKTGTF